MNLTRAMELMGIKSLNTIDKSNLSNIYRRMIKLYHPDINNTDGSIASDINTAYDILLKAIENFEVYKDTYTIGIKDIFGVIQLDQLIDIFNNKSIDIISNNKKVTLNKFNIKTYRIAVCLECCIKYNGKVKYFSDITPVTLRDDYSMDCYLEADDSVNNIIVEAYSKNIELKLGTHIVHLRLNYTNGVSLTLNIIKQGE